MEKIMIFVLTCFATFCVNKNDESLNSHISAITDILQSRQKSIDSELLKEIKPVIDNWLKYHDLNISGFMINNTNHLDIERLKNDKSYAYYNYTEFTKENEAYNPLFHDYSPDRMKYINLLEASLVSPESDGKYHYSGSDDSKGICLYNRKDKSAVLISYRGYLDEAEAAFWVNDDMFIITGYARLNNPGEFTLEIYDISKNKQTRYSLAKAYKRDESYLLANMKERGVIID